MGLKGGNEPMTGTTRRRRTWQGGAARTMVLAAALGAAASAACAQGERLHQQGREIYERNCALCHQTSGMGDPPSFPALSGNPVVADLARIVGNIHEGRGGMPPFPTLGPEEIASVATYVRGAWENSFSHADPEEVAIILDRLGGTTDTLSMWDGVYTMEQAERGATAYRGPCGLCHGKRLDGAPDDPDMRPAPALARYKFIRDWEGRSLATLFDYAKATMPQSNPGYMPDQTYVDIIAHMLEMSGAPAGDTELTSDQMHLARILIGPGP